MALGSKLAAEFKNLNVIDHASFADVKLNSIRIGLANETFLDDLELCHVTMVVIRHHFHINVILTIRSTFLHYIVSCLNWAHALAYNIGFIIVDDHNGPFISLGYNVWEHQAVASLDYTAIIVFETFLSFVGIIIGSPSVIEAFDIVDFLKHSQLVHIVLDQSMAFDNLLMVLIPHIKHH